MTAEKWLGVDRYFEARLVPGDPVLDAVLAASRAAGLPAHELSPTQGKFLHLLARAIGARRVLEIGTLGGYSTIWLARALPADGQVVTLESDPAHAAVARANFHRAGLEDRITLHVGPALLTLPDVARAAPAPFDLVFIDADKPSNPEYLSWALRLARPGTLIVGDNVVRDGAVVDPAHPDPRVRGVRRFLDQMAREPRLSATALQTVGAKGWDGFALALVEGPAPGSIHPLTE